MNEPGEKSYKVTKTVYLRPQDEIKWEEELDRHPVLVKGKMYGPTEWNDPAWHSLEGTLPPWIRDQGVVDTKESRHWVPHPGGVRANLKAIYLAEEKRMKDNKGYTLYFLEETEDIKIISEPWDEVKSQTRPQQKAEGDVQGGLEDVTPPEVRTTERNETLQLEELDEISPWEELEAAIKTEWVQTKGGDRADLGATVRSVAR